MSILQTVKDLFKSSIEKRDNETRVILGVYLGDLDTQTKGKTGEVDAEAIIVDILQNNYRSSKKTLELQPEGGKSDYYRKEMQIITSLLPEDKLPIETSDMLSIIEANYEGVKTKPNVMKWLSQNYKGRYVGKEVAPLVDEYLRK